MRVCIAGPRNLRPSVIDVADAIDDSGFEPSMIVTGGARGVDGRADAYARKQCIPRAIFPAKWGTYGDVAGPIRNRDMAKFSDALIVIKYKDKDTRGTSSMITQAERAGIPIYIHEMTS